MITETLSKELTETMSKIQTLKCFKKNKQKKKKQKMISKMWEDF